MLKRLLTTKRMHRTLAAFAAAVFMLAGFFTINMAMGHLPGMTGCAIGSASSDMTQGGSLCSMPPVEHLSWWANTFTGIPGTNTLLSLIALTGLVLIAAILLPSADLLSSLHALVRRGTDPPDASVRDYFSRFLARGLAQPLLYA